MKKPLIVRAEAEADMAEAYEWYEQQVRGLGGEFLLCVDAVMASIERNPQLYPVVHKDVIRRALTRRFPHGVFFVEGERNVSVIAVAHAKRNPRVWQVRI
ncbi:MAG: type II toxin-antitoxin system RelE/ParE family toxin [Desulfobulbaceae bacterium]